MNINLCCSRQTHYRVVNIAVLEFQIRWVLQQHPVRCDW